MEGMDHIGGRARGGDAYHGVVGIDAVLLQFLPSAHRIVLGVLYRMTECTVAAGNQSDDPARRHAEGGWNLGGVEHAQPSAGACSHIEEASAPLHPFDDGSDQTFDLGDALMDCQSHLAVFFVDALQQFVHRLTVEFVVQRGLFGDFDETHDGMFFPV